MRARKAERCLQRAAAALDDGSIDEARDALEEARQLSPLDPRLDKLSARLDALKHPAPPPPAVAGHGSLWTSAAIIAGLVVVSAAGWGGWVYKDQIVQLVPTPHTDMDATTGLAAPAANNAANAPSTLAGNEDAGDAKSNDTVVQTTLVRPDQVIDTRTEASSEQPATPLVSDATTGSEQPSDSKPEAIKALATPTAPELPARSQRDAPPLPTSLEYRAPAVLPATPIPAPSTTFIPSVAPPAEPPRAINATTPSATTANLATNTTAPPPVANAPASSPDPAASTPAPEPSAARDERVAIRAALSRYESAYNRLDVDAVRSVWPSLDQRALARAFDSLTSQRVALQNCNVDVSGSTARANCSGNASWTPKVGGGQRSSARKWTFDLSEANGAWRITHVLAR